MKLHTGLLDDAVAAAQHCSYLALQTADCRVFAVLGSGIPDVLAVRNPEAQRWNPSSYK
jgi:hypothetical protein